MVSGILQQTPKGLYCPQADVYIDPSRRVGKAIITHAHADHAHRGHKSYLAHWQSENILRLRLGKINLEVVEYNRKINMNGVTISLHPAGHVVGSAQVRLEYKGYVSVITGDYKTENDHLCIPFESVKCNELVSECTFGLPIYHWEPQEKIFNKINTWWLKNQVFL